MSNFPSFQTSRLLLKPISLDYVKDYEKHFIDYEVIQYLSATVPWPYPRDGIKAFLEAVILPEQGKKRWTWGIFRKENPDELIGCVDLWREGTPENRGFWLGRDFWDQGYMTEAIAPVMDYAFSELGFDEVYLSNALGNTRSRRVKEKSGAVLVGTRPAEFVSKDFREAETWLLTKEAWFSHRS